MRRYGDFSRCYDVLLPVYSYSYELFIRRRSRFVDHFLFLKGVTYA